MPRQVEDEEAARRPDHVLELSKTSSRDEDIASRKATTTAGLSHVLELRNRYYSADIPIWLDEVGTPSSWCNDFKTIEAQDVVRAVGAWIVVFKTPPISAEAKKHTENLLRAVQEVVEATHGGDGMWEGLCLAVGMSCSRIGKSGDYDVTAELGKHGWEDICFDYGFEYIDASEDSSVRTPDTRELQGLARLKEALEANEWSLLREDNLDDKQSLLGSENEDGTNELAAGDGFELEQMELEREFMGLKMAMMQEDQPETGGSQGGEAQEVENLERMLNKLQAVRGEFLCSSPIEMLFSDFARNERPPTARAEEESCRSSG